ncbi:hypothetical protein Peur_039733 [Populus x canadensis]|jgi:hypothetical protein
MFILLPPCLSTIAICFLLLISFKFASEAKGSLYPVGDMLQLQLISFFILFYFDFLQVAGFVQGIFG